MSDGRLFDIVAQYYLLSEEEEAWLARIIDESFSPDHPTPYLENSLKKASERVQGAYRILTGHFVALLGFHGMPGAELFTQHLKVLGETVTLVTRQGAVTYVEVHSIREISWAAWEKGWYKIRYVPQFGEFICELSSQFVLPGIQDIMRFPTLKSALRYARKRVVELPTHVDSPKAKAGWFRELLRLGLFPA